MPGTNEIRQHIAAVEQTKKITGAMQMVSSNRMKQVMVHIEQNRLYFMNIRRMMRELLLTSQDVSHSYLSGRSRNHCTFLVISGDKGLCGAHNSNILNFALSRIRETPGASLITKSSVLIRLRFSYLVCKSSCALCPSISS